jgi:glycolate oxidase FAD binding subunit
MASELEHLIDRIRAAHAAGTPLRLRGGGTKDFLGDALAGEVLSTTGWRGIVSYEPSELVVTARAGTPLAELEAVLAERGQCLPFEPPHFGAGATVGGMVAAGLSGPSRASVGSVRDYVLGTTLVNGRGQTLVFGGQVMKNVAGYDVSRLMAGSLGTLALIAEVSLKVLPSAPAECTLRFEGLPEAEALRRMNRWAGQPLPLNAAAWFEGNLWLRLRGARAAVQSATRALGAEGAQDLAADASPWTSMREQSHPFFAPVAGDGLWRLSVADTTPPLDLGPTLIEWGGAQRWVRARPGADVAARLREAATRAGGHATRWRAAEGDEPRVGAFTPLTPALLRIHQGLKREFDPAGILGPGRMAPDF